MVACHARHLQCVSIEANKTFYSSKQSIRARLAYYKATESDDVWSQKDESVAGTPIREAEEASDAAILASLKPPAVKVVLPPAEKALYESQQVSSCFLLFSLLYSCGSPWPWACCAVRVCMFVRMCVQTCLACVVLLCSGRPMAMGKLMAVQCSALLISHGHGLLPLFCLSLSFWAFRRSALTSSLCLFVYLCSTPRARSSSALSLR
jgi:hypothetical protein